MLQWYGYSKTVRFRTGESANPFKS